MNTTQSGLKHFGLALCCCDLAKAELGSTFCCALVRPALLLLVLLLAVAAAMAAAMGSSCCDCSLPGPCTSASAAGCCACALDGRKPNPKEPLRQQHIYNMYTLAADKPCHSRFLFRVQTLDPNSPRQIHSVIAFCQGSSRGTRLGPCLPIEQGSAG